jgi:hypothetical protein
MLSQNGWPVVGKTACDTGLFQGTTFPNGILAGDVATIARWQLARYETTVEPIVTETCWGWFVKPIEGSTVVSNHASGTAWDINADQHPMGESAARSFTAAQIRACRAIVADSDGVLRWGGDYTGRPDPMHWEINASAAKVRALADAIRAGEKDEPMTNDDIEKLLTTHVVTAAGKDYGELRGVLATLMIRTDALANQGAGNAAVLAAVAALQKQMAALQAHLA